MKKTKYLLLFILSLSLIALNVSADNREPVLSENDVILIEKALDSTAPDCEFSAAVALASVIINRYHSNIYPDSVLKIIEGADFLTIDHTVTPGERSKRAVTFALQGTSPIKDATGAFRVENEEDVSVAEYIIIGNWCFYAE